MPLSVGDKLGPYEIVALLGAGGMGEVYRARDTRLGRDVAVKISADRFSDRFAHEARLIASLNHPNICTLHDVGPNYLVMELVEGETLSALLRAGALPPERVLRCGAEIAAALAAAHAKGIVHRDLKPGNIMITKSGGKVLDFGLAKMAPGPARPAELTETLTAQHVVMGTLSYMAPEQLSGGECDARTDIFALGLILYEMSAGRPAFVGSSREALMAEILRCQPPPLDAVPALLSRVVERCLARDPDERWQSASDLRAALELAAFPLAPAHTAKTNPRAMWLALLVVLAVILIGVVAWPKRGSTVREPAAFSFSAPEGAALARWPGVPSPDGRLIAFVASDASGRTGLWLRALASSTARPLPGTEDASGPFWSPDGLFLGFFGQGKLKKIAVSGGPAQNICSISSDLGATWNISGDIVLAPHNRVPLHRVSASGGTAQPITTLSTARGENSHRWPHFLPDGRHFLFTARSNSKENTAIYLGSLDSRETRLLLAEQSNASFAPPGFLLFGREGTLMAQRFDARKLVLEGDAFPVAGGVEHVRPSANAIFSVSLNGSVLTFQLENRVRGQLLWLDRAGTNSGAIGLPGEYFQPRLSPDGKRVAVVVVDPESGNRDVWLMDVASGRATRFTFHPATDWKPVWSQDGAFIAFASDRTAPSSVYRKASGGTGEEELLLSRSEGGLFPEDFSKDGRFLLFHLNVGSSQTLWTMPLFGERIARPLPFSTTSMHARYSPDGKWLAYTSSEAGSSEIYVSPAEGGEKVRVSTAGGQFATWGKAGKELFYVAPGEVLMSAEVKVGQTLEVGVPKILFRMCPRTHTLRGSEAFYDAATDGNRFLVSCTSPEAKVRSVNVMLEWQSLLKETKRE